MPTVLTEYVFITKKGRHFSYFIRKCIFNTKKCLLDQELKKALDFKN